MTYEQVAFISQIAALILFIAVFTAVAAYAYWPSNRAKFERAARLPLDTDREAATAVAAGLKRRAP